MEFEYRSYPSHVLFGRGRFGDLAGHLKAYEKVLVIGSDRMRGRVSQLRDTLGEGKVAHFAHIVQHIPEAVVGEARRYMQSVNPQVLVAMGGGSAIGLAKALAVEVNLPVVALPTTYSGSEQTNIWGISTGNGKITGKSDRALPSLVIYDTDFTADMPFGLAVKSAMNAMAHLMEAIYAPDGNPVTRHHALQGIKTLRKGLLLLADRQALTAEANETILFGAYLAGKCLCEVSMSLHHKTAHVLGGTFGLDHASVHTVLQPYILKYQWPYLSEEAKEDFMQTLGSNPVMELRNLAQKAGGPAALGDIGFDKADISKAVDEILARPYANIAPLEKQALQVMLESAWEGEIS